MNYKTISELNRDILAWIPELPRDINVIVGIPRSGLLVANILGLHLNLPITDIDGLIDGKLLSSGRRPLKERNQLVKGSKILVVDDSVHSGYQMSKVQEKIRKRDLPYRISYGAVYALSNSIDKTDIFKEVLPMPRIFEWNLFHHGIMKSSCVDIDGVLCRDPSKEENDDGHKYRQFILNVAPNIIPTRKIGWLVTCRLEKYRELTEQWLSKNNILYDNLVMMDYNTREERIRAGNHGKYKANVYKKVKAKLFIESSRGQANEIAKISGKPVVCYQGDSKIIYPNRLSILKKQTRNYSKQFLNSPIGFAKRGFKKLNRELR
ncbi:orotate phosphoribosyltransferase [Fodinibius roseus]|uniref:Orotate phosphoribosyltransferase n=1 Tax=Fodinibius roseus TaxID=1194090 RepID=A0A1M4STI9_9BACT|nr:phosphoribosyltransferase family protein [Fodinibius roseus]SHE35485.1 orotate phosphoribosyltransferase [Fodinibius roseus]